jgi:hypothetical protein
MYSESDGYQEDWRWDGVDEEVRRLAEETTELGIAVEDAFKNATAALFDSDIAVEPDESERLDLPPDVDAPIRARILQLLGYSNLTGEQMRRIAELQSIAAAFAAMGEKARQIAGHTLALGEAVETELRMTAADLYDSLWVLVRQTFHEIRGSIMVANSRDTALARRVLQEDAMLDQAYLDVRYAVLRAIERDPHRAFFFHQVALMSALMEEIGNQAGAVCRAVLHAPARGARPTIGPAPGGNA